MAQTLLTSFFGSSGQRTTHRSHLKRSTDRVCRLGNFVIYIALFLFAALSVAAWAQYPWLSNISLGPLVADKEGLPERISETGQDVDDWEGNGINEGSEDNEGDYARFDTSMAMRDVSQNYSVHAFMVTASRWPQMASQTVCLATHATLDHMHYLLDASVGWGGPISMAVFTPDIEYQLVQDYIRYLRSCFPTVLRQVSFHFVYPADRPAREDPALPRLQSSYREHREDGSCAGHAHKVLEELMALRPKTMLAEWRERLPYPQNLMRNVARAACPHAFVMCPDVDMVATMHGLRAQLAAFLQQPAQLECRRCAYVVPVYEVRETERAPANKTELLRLVKRSKARPFHLEVFYPNQGLSKLPMWEKGGEGPAMNVSHPIGNYTFFYEPVYVARRNVPRFDERFVGFGHTRNTQVYEMMVAGWDFLVLNNAFLVHWGYQSLRSRPPWRQVQANINSRRFPGFLRDVALRYDRDPFGMLTKFPQRSARVILKAPKPQKRSDRSAAKPPF